MAKRKRATGNTSYPAKREGGTPRKPPVYKPKPNRRMSQCPHCSKVVRADHLSRHVGTTHADKATKRQKLAALRSR